MTLGEKANEEKRAGLLESSHSQVEVGSVAWRCCNPSPSHLNVDQRYPGESSLGESVDGIGVDGLGLLLGVALVELHELGQIELGLLENLDLLDHDVLEREDLGALLGDLLDAGVG